MASKYMQLFQERADLAREGETLGEVEGSWTVAQQKRSSGIISRIVAIDAELVPIVAERERQRHAPSRGGVLDGLPPSIGDNLMATDPPARRAAPGGRHSAEMFGQPAAMPCGKEDFYASVGLGLAHPALVPMAVATGGVLSDGGFAVPEPLVAEMLNAALEDEIVRPRADVVPMTSSTRKVWGFDASDSSSKLYGGFAGQWTGEGNEITVETPKLRMNELKANKLAVLVEISNELFDDAIGYSAQLEAAMIKAISWYMDYGFLRGSGAGAPKGVLSDSALIAVDKVATQAGATIVFANLADMENRLHPASVNNAIFVAAPGTRAQLLQLTIPVGTAGGSWVPVLEGGPGKYTLLKRPCIFSEKLPQLGAQGDILLADFSQYSIGLRKEMSLDKSGHAGFTRDTSHFRAILRGDGMGKWSSAYTPKAGASLSWCVTLKVRA